MQKLSPLYRNDDPADLSPGIREYLDEHFWQMLENRDVPHAKLLVVFSGGNGVGKSTLARRIGKELHGIVIENDAIKRVMLQRDPHIGDLRYTYAWQYSMSLYERLPELTGNGLVVRDGVIDWYYDRILPIFARAGYGLFVIAYDLSDQKRIELLEARGDTDVESIEKLRAFEADNTIHMKRLRSEYAPDIVLNDDTVFDHESVVAKIRERMRELEA